MRRSGIGLLPAAIIGVTLVLSTVLGVGLLSLHTGPRLARAQHVDRTTVVQQFFAASNRGDVDGAMARLTDTQTARNASTTPSQAQTGQAPAVDRIAVVQQIFDARNRNDVDAALTLFTSTAGVIARIDCDLARPCVGSVALRTWLEAQVPNHSVFTIINIELSGTIVTGRVEVRSDLVRAAGVERLINAFVVNIINDKASAFVFLADYADEQTAQRFGITPSPKLPQP